MKVFKLFFKILKMHSKTFIMYTGIFFAITLIVSSSSENIKDGYVSKSCKFAYFDYDNTEASKEIIGYLSEKNEVVEIKKDDNELIQDELYNRNVDSVLRVEEGFEEALKSENIKENIENYLELLTIPSTQKSTVLETQVNGFMKLFVTYIQSGYEIKEATKEAKEATEITGKVKMLSDNENSNHSKIYYFFLYCAYVFIAIAIEAVGMIILVMNKEELQNRIKASSYKFSLYYKELFLAVICAGMGIAVFYIIMSVILYNSEMFTIKGLLFIINMVCMMLVALSISFVVSQFTKKENSLNMISNIVALASSFICGVFVPLEFMDNNVIKLAHFLPSYWYVNACEKIDFYTKSSQLYDIFKYIGVELLFVAAFCAVGLAIAKTKKAER